MTKAALSSVGNPNFFCADVTFAAASQSIHRANFAGKVPPISPPGAWHR